MTTKLCGCIFTSKQINQEICLWLICSLIWQRLQSWVWLVLHSQYNFEIKINNKVSNMFWHFLLNECLYWSAVKLLLLSDPSRIRSLTQRYCLGFVDFLLGIYSHEQKIQDWISILQQLCAENWLQTVCDQAIKDGQGNNSGATNKYPHHNNPTQTASFPNQRLGLIIHPNLNELAPRLGRQPQLNCC